MSRDTTRLNLPDIDRPAFDPHTEKARDEELKRRLAAEARPLGFRPNTPERAPPASKPRASLKTLQLLIPEYLFEELHLKAARQRVTKKYLVLRALAAAGYHVEVADLEEDGRRLR
jgi:hypothetical protein